MSGIIEITDPSAPELQIYTDLTHGDPGRIGPLFLAESEKVIEYALASGCRPVSFLMERQDAREHPLVGKWADIPVYTGSREQLRQLTGYALSRGFLCAMERPQLPSENAVWNNASRIVILKNISDPTDLGAIFRSATALGMDGILIGENCCDPLYRRAVRVSMGTVFQVPWTLQTSPVPEDFSLITVSASPSGAPIEEEAWRSRDKLAIILDGKDRVDSYCIPLRPDTENLNMAAASAVLFWMLRK